MKNIKCPKCGNDEEWTIFPKKDKRLWKCDSCGFIIYKKKRGHKKIRKRKMKNKIKEKLCMICGNVMNTSKGCGISTNVVHRSSNWVTCSTKCAKRYRRIYVYCYNKVKLSIIKKCQDAQDKQVEELKKKKKQDDYFKCLDCGNITDMDICPECASRNLERKFIIDFEDVDKIFKKDKK